MLRFKTLVSLVVVLFAGSLMGGSLPACSDESQGGSGGSAGQGGEGGSAGQGGAGGGGDVLCTSTGGTVDMGLCCLSSGDFPSSCLTGACGCAPNNSHMVKTCTCPAAQCFDPAVGCKPM